MKNKQFKFILILLAVLALLFWSVFFISHRVGSPGFITESLKLSHEAPDNQSDDSSGNQLNSSHVQDFAVLWISDFIGNRILGLSPTGETIWEQNMSKQPIPDESRNVSCEYVTVAPNGNLIVADGDGMMVQEIDRKTHALIWQYGVRSKQGYSNGLIHQPDKSFKINDHEVVINDGNNRRVIIVDQRTNDIVWQYGENMKMGSEPGFLKGNTCVVPLNEGQQFIITDTLENKIIIVDRATKQIIWEWKKPDAAWLEHVFPTKEGTFILEDRLQNEVFEVDREGKILWTIERLADGSYLNYPTDTAKLSNGNILIAEAQRGRVIEVVPDTGKIVRQFNGTGFVTTIAVDQKGL